MKTILPLAVWLLVVVGFALADAELRESPPQALENFIVEQLARHRPQWAKEEQREYASAVAQYLLRWMPKEEGRDFLGEFKEAFPAALDYLCPYEKFYEEHPLLGIRVTQKGYLRVCIERSKHAIRQWLRREPAGPEEREKVMAQIQRIWEIADHVIKAHPAEVDLEAWTRRRQQALEQHRAECFNPLILHFKKPFPPLDDGQIQAALQEQLAQARQRWEQNQKQLPLPSNPPVPEMFQRHALGPPLHEYFARNVESYIYDLSPDTGPFLPVRLQAAYEEAHAEREMGDERFQRTKQEVDITENTKRLLRLMEVVEPLEWVGYLAMGSLTIESEMPLWALGGW